jgi:hypothetical protein
MGKYIGRSIPYGLFESQDLSSDTNGTKTIFPLIYNVPNSSSILVVYSGSVLQPTVDYTITEAGSKIQFNDAPDSGLSLHILYLGRELLVPSTIGNSPLLVQIEADGIESEYEITTTLTLTHHGLIIFKNGIQQRHLDDFTITSTNTVLLSTTPSNGDKLDFYIVGAERSDLVTVGEGTITTSKLDDGAVTPDKMNLSFSTYSPTVTTFESMVSSTIVEEADYQEFNTHVKARIKIRTTLSGTEDNKIRVTLPINNDGSAFISSSATIVSDESIESGIVRWGSNNSVDIFRQFGVNYTLDTHTIEISVEYKK